MLPVSRSLALRACAAVAVALAVVACGGETSPTEPPAKLAFMVQPSNAVAGMAISPAVVVAIQDAVGNTMVGATNTVTVAIATNPGSGTLAGTTTVNAVRGEATFGDLSIDQRGIGYTLAATSGTLVGAASTPFDTRLSFTGVSAGGGHTCGLITAGVAYCWGNNGSGGLGDGTTTDRMSPVAVLGGLSFAAVRAGGSDSCGVRTGGAAYCWGLNSYGQLGDGTMTSQVSPVAVTGGVLGGFSFVAISAGLFHTCAVTTPGAAYCWGDNGLGQLGDGTMTSRASPVLVLGGLTFAAVSAAAYHTCGVTTTDAAYCWGDNASGQIGDGTTTDRTSPVAVLGGRTFAAVSAGFSHTCGITTAGAAYCWGSNSSGELGDGTMTNQVSPVGVLGGLSFFAVSTGGAGLGDHTCGVTTTGAAYCWGFNGSGQLGDGTTTDRTNPTPVLGALNFAAVSAGGSHTSGVTTAGAAYCWGENGNAQLGDGTRVSRVAPVLVQ